jgi:UDP-2,4-diacetamido-2,4,6-trideoxy-beta-L-altropyranose hydrolase
MQIFSAPQRPCENLSRTDVSRPPAAPQMDRISVLLRADASRQVGVGHVMRCLTLGAELRRQGAEVTLASYELTDHVQQRARNLGIQVHFIAGPIGSDEDVDFVTSAPVDIVIVDGYEFEPEYFSALASAGVRYAVIDDDGRHAGVDPLLLINPNANAERSMYPGIQAHQIAVGAEYLLVRDEVTKLAASRHLQPDQRGHTVLVAIGGTDVLGLNAAIAKELVRELGVTTIVAGPDVPPGALQADPDIASELASCTVAVIGGGSTIWEAACLGTPSVVLVVADNQSAGAAAAERAGSAVRLDCRDGVPMAEILSAVGELLEDRDRRNAAAAAGPRLVDCRGTQRVAQRLLSVVSR